MILLLIFKALKSKAPVYICDLFIPYEPDRCMKSSGRALLWFQNLDLLPKVTVLLLSVHLSRGTPCLEILGRLLSEVSS